GNRIGRITTSGVITEFPIPTANSAPVGINPGPDGNMWFTEIQGNKVGRVNLISVDGAPISVAAGQTYSGVVANVVVQDPNLSSSAMQPVINWGDGSTTGGVITGSAQTGFSVTGTHTYQQFGSYIASVTVSSATGGIQTSTSTVAVNVHNLLDTSFENRVVGFGNFVYNATGSAWTFS